MLRRHADVARRLRHVAISFIFDCRTMLRRHMLLILRHDAMRDADALLERYHDAACSDIENNCLHCRSERVHDARMPRHARCCLCQAFSCCALPFTMRCEPCRHVCVYFTMIRVTLPPNDADTPPTMLLRRHDIRAPPAAAARHAPCHVDAAVLLRFA